MFEEKVDSSDRKFFNCRRKEVDNLIMDTLNEKRPASDEEEEESEEEEKKPVKRGRKAAAPAKNGSDSGSEEDFEPAAPKRGRKAAVRTLLLISVHRWNEF